MCFRVSVIHCTWNSRLSFIRLKTRVKTEAWRASTGPRMTRDTFARVPCHSHVTLDFLKRNQDEEKDEEDDKDIEQERKRERESQR
jgi:hypothetical protein